MNENYKDLEELKHLYPDEWVLLGDPKMENTSVLGGTVLYHSKDKKEVCYIGRDRAESFSSVTVTFTGDLKQHRKIGMLRRL